MRYTGLVLTVIKQLTEERGLSARQIERITHVPHPTVSRLIRENGWTRGKSWREL